MKHLLVCVLAIVGLLMTGCDGGAASDVKKPPEDVRKQAEGMSVADLEKRLAELEKMSEALTKKVGTSEPTEAQMTEMSKLMETAGIYAAELIKKKMK